MPIERQDEAVSPAVEGNRKVVLSTSIAESSLTLPGVRVVVDAGQSRASVFSPRTGMSRLVTQPVSKASADQRRGVQGELHLGCAIDCGAKRFMTVCQMQPDRRLPPRTSHRWRWSLPPGVSSPLQNCSGWTSRLPRLRPGTGAAAPAGRPG